MVLYVCYKPKASCFRANVLKEYRMFILIQSATGILEKGLSQNI